MDSIGRLIAAVIAAVLIFLYPLQNIAQMMGETIDDVINEYTSEFTQKALDEGEINLDLYEELAYQMDSTGELYDVTIEAAHPVSGLEIEEASISEQMPKLRMIPTSYKGTSEKNDSDLYSTDTSADNTSVMNSLNSIPYSRITSFTSHIHTSDCYAGHNHISSCYAIVAADASIKAVVGNVNFFLSYYDYKQVQEGNWTRSSYYRMRCSDCNTELGYIKEFFNSADGRVPRIEIFRSYYDGTSTAVYCRFVNADEAAYPIMIRALRGLNLTSYTQVEARKQLLVTAGFNDYLMCPTCAKKSGKSSTVLTLGKPVMICGLIQDTIPVCNQVVDSITASSTVQKVNKGGSIVTTATATYLDGHTATVACNSNFNTNITGIQNVTLTYSGLVGNAKTTGTRICTTSVTVQEDMIPSYLTVTPSLYTVYNGNEPTYTVAVTYESGVSKILTAGYVKTGWSTGSGTKTVIFTYTENSKTVTAKISITVKGNLTSLSVSPSIQSVKRYSNPVFTVTAYYEDGTSAVVTGFHIEGINTNNLGMQTVSISYLENAITKKAAATVTVTLLTTTCPICGTSYELDNNDGDTGCPICSIYLSEIIVTPSYIVLTLGESLPIKVTAVYRNGRSEMVEGWTSDYDSTKIGPQEVTVSYKECTALVSAEIAGIIVCPVCTREYDLKADGTDPGCPYCKETAVSITVFPVNVTIEKYQPFPITVTALYQDGHTAEVTDWSSSLVADTKGTYDATISYQSVMTKLSVTIKESGMLECNYCGLSYQFSESPKGCPNCYFELRGIEAGLRNGGTLVPYKSDISLQITKIMRDTHREMTYTGWTVEGYTADKLGEQTIRVFYGGISTTLVIEVVNDQPYTVCPNGHTYYLNEDGTDPGCPYCDDTTDKDSALFYFDITYTEEIVSTIYAEGTYILTQGDYLTVTVSARNTSFIARITDRNFNTDTAIAGKKYIYGGEVL